jgi:opacity protein-like surface antigen
MKKLLITSAVLFIAATGFSQHLSLNLYGGYTFRDRINFGNAYAFINAGGIFGGSLEGVNAQGTGVELQYQYQRTNIPLYSYPQNVQLNTNTTATISYLLLNFEQYLMNNPKIQPYGGIGLGAAFVTASSNSTKFAWDLKAGVKIKAGNSVGVKIGAQLLGSAQATGTAFYSPGFGYPPYAYTTYATVLQFGFTGGLVFDFGGH